MRSKPSNPSGVGRGQYPTGRPSPNADPSNHAPATPSKSAQSTSGARPGGHFTIGCIDPTDSPTPWSWASRTNRSSTATAAASAGSPRDSNRGITPANAAGSVATTAAQSSVAATFNGATPASDTSATLSVTGTDPSTSPVGPSSRSHPPVVSPTRAASAVLNSTHTSTGPPRAPGGAATVGRSGSRAVVRSIVPVD